MIFLIFTFAIIWYIFDRLCGIPWIKGTQKKCVFISGCDSGFGNALAKSLYTRGVYVFAGCYTEEGARKLLGETGERLKTVKLDVSNSESIKNAREFVEKNIPSNCEFWGLVNNAGIAGMGGPIEFISRDDMRTVMEVNCFGMVEMVQIFLPLIKKSKGRILNISSAIADTFYPATYPYLMSKHALTAFSGALRHEKAIWDIKVITIHPGMFKTDIINLDEVKKSSKSQWENLDPSFKKEYGREYIEHRIKAVTGSIESIAVPDLSYVTRSLEHALFARYPQSSYYPGPWTSTINTMARWCPPFLADILHQFILKKNLPAALKK